MAIFFGVIIAIIAVTLAARAFVAADPAKVSRALWWVGVWGVFALGLFLTIRGPVFIGAPLLFLAFQGLRPLFGRRRRRTGAWSPSGGSAGAGPGGFAPGGESRVSSAFVDMTLDHATGAMDGVVKRGSYTGRRLSDLGEVDLDILWREAGVSDADSAALLFAYYRRRFGRDPDLEGTEAPTGSGGPMSLEEAREILGVGAGASAEDVRAAHRRLLQRAHPDAGGSDWLAAKINAARDRLLEALGD